jgi:hypothetical protein
MWKKAFLVLGLVVVAAALALTFWIGPRNVIGLLRYDQRRPGRLQVGDSAPDVTLTALDGSSRKLLQGGGSRPLVLVFGSYT